MKLLLLCLGLTLVCAHGQEKHDVVTSNFDMAKISGEWYTVLLAADSMEKIEENGSFRSFIEYIWVFDNSSLLLKYNKNSPYQTQILHLRNLKVVLIQRINGECTALFFVPDEKEEKGVYDVPYDGHNSIQIAEAVYDEYLILYVLNFDHEKTTNIIVLNARNLDVTPRLRKAFEKNCEKYGIPTENIVDVSNADPCIQTRGNHGSQSSSAE